MSTVDNWRRSRQPLLENGGTLGRKFGLGGCSGAKGGRKDVLGPKHVPLVVGVGHCERTDISRQPIHQLGKDGVANLVGVRGNGSCALWGIRTSSIAPKHQMREGAFTYSRSLKCLRDLAAAVVELHLALRPLEPACECTAAFWWRQPWPRTCDPRSQLLRFVSQ